MRLIDGIKPIAAKPIRQGKIKLCHQPQMPRNILGESSVALPRFLNSHYYPRASRLTSFLDMTLLGTAEHSGHEQVLAF